MSFGDSSKHKTVLFVAGVVAAVSAFVFLYSPVIFQEGNPWPQIKGIAQLTFRDNDMVKLDTERDVYITRGDNFERVNSFMQEKGYDFTEQLGSGYFFKSNTGASAVVTHKYYSRYYSLWTITVSDSVAPGAYPWIAVTNEYGVAFLYPQEITATYISTAVWPPQVRVYNEPFRCAPAGSENQATQETALRLVDDRSYCVTRTSEGAAGSVYATYSYVFPLNNKTGVIDFTLRLVQCSNYSEPMASECEAERSTFDIDSVVDRIAQSVRLELAAALQECMPKSDIASRDTCQELLSIITNFEDCAAAGFAVMESYPPRCATPDGRSFTAQAQNTWTDIVSAVSNCQVRQIMQAHSLRVTATLKDGNKLVAFEPKIDEIFDVVAASESRCGRIIMATE